MVETPSGLMESDIRNAAEAILRAEREGEAMPPLSGQHAGFSLDDAYRVQDLLTTIRQQQGVTLAGYKIGLTWRTTQIACDLDAPIHGRILRHAVHQSGASLPARRLVKPHVEVELAFIMSRDVDRPIENLDALLAATDCIVPALELVDHRMAPPRIVADTVADNSAFAGVIIPTDVILAKLGLECGFNDAEILVTRHLTVAPQQRNKLATLEDTMRESVVVLS